MSLYTDPEAVRIRRFGCFLSNDFASTVLPARMRKASRVASCITGRLERDRRREA